jgi:hypothetical protein
VIFNARTKIGGTQEDAHLDRLYRRPLLSSVDSNPGVPLENGLPSGFGAGTVSLPQATTDVTTPERRHRKTRGRDASNDAAVKVWWHREQPSRPHLLGDALRN